MAYLKVENVRITGISAGVPKHAEGSVSTTDKYGAEDFVQTTGIKEKRYDERLTTSDLGLPAAEKLIADLGWDKKEIGALVFVSQTPDYILPATACILQAKLGLERSCMAMDINLGCSGWVYGLSVLSSLMQTGNIKKESCWLVMLVNKQKKSWINSLVMLVQLRHWNTVRRQNRSILIWELMVLVMMRLFARVVVAETSLMKIL